MKVNFNNNRSFRRFILIWLLFIVTMFLSWTWYSPPNIPTGTATVITTMLGLFGVFFGMYQWSRKSDEEWFKYLNELECNKLKEELKELKESQNVKDIKNN